MRRPREMSESALRKTSSAITNKRLLFHRSVVLTIPLLLALVVSQQLVRCVESWSTATRQKPQRQTFSSRRHLSAWVANHREGGMVNGDRGDGDCRDSFELPPDSSIPKHVGFICDGNSRWASARNLPSAAGHAAGAERLVQVLRGLKQAGISYCTMYAFSTENWKRSDHEVREILAVMEATARKFASQLVRDKVQLRILGDLQDPRIPASLRVLLDQLQDDTKIATRDIPEPQTLCLAINYGGRRDIVVAAKRVAKLVAEGSVAVEDITEDLFANQLGTAGIPDPDLIIRTSGECRLSNFLLWNVAYSEIYFTQRLWPDFDRESLETALQWYSSRVRRFGSRVVEKVQQERFTTTTTFYRKP